MTMASAGTEKQMSRQVDINLELKRLRMRLIEEDFHRLMFEIEGA